MTIPDALSKSFSEMWGVLVLFLIPVGGGIPAGVLLAQKHGIAWPLMTALYFVSDVILAFLFEPIMLFFIWVGRHVPPLQKFIAAMKASTQKTVAKYGTSTGPLALIMIAFGVDPMTGRAAAVAAGHGFVTGWMIAITGDMMFFMLLMVSTIWLKGVLGDGTWASLIILVVMMVAPAIIRHIKDRVKNLYKDIKAR